MRLPLIRLLAAIIVAALLSPAAALDYLPSGPAASPPSDGRARGLAPVYQPAPSALLQTFSIGAKGAVRAVRQAQWRWRQAYDLTPPRWGIPGRRWRRRRDAGELLRCSGWTAPARPICWNRATMGGAGEDRAGRLFRAGAQLSAVWQPGDGQMMAGSTAMAESATINVSAVFT